MPRYHKLGKIPPKRHTTFEKPDGSLYQEELFGTAGFAGMSSLIYHLYPPTVVSEVKRGEDVSPKIAIDKNPKMAKIGWYLTIIKLALKIISTLVFKLNQI